MRVPSITNGVGVKVLVGFCVRVGVSFVGGVVNLRSILHVYNDGSKLYHVLFSDRYFMRLRTDPVRF